MNYSNAANYPFTSITSSGFYKLASDVTNQITITVPNVTLDLNGHAVSGGANGIVINSGLNNVTIKNGTISGVADGIQVNNGCNDITLLNVAAKNCIRGIACTQIADAVIRNCDLISNTTGIEVDESNNVYMQDCVAQANIQAGYSLFSSSTCTLQECKAIATGEGNTSIFGDTSNVFGFVSSDGYGNIFECCIANATQALTTTDANSVVAGFGLKGTEGCSKIISCEASNGITSSSGDTVPYGIWLEPQFDQLISITAVNPDPVSTADEIYSVAWSPDGQYLAVGGIIVGDTGNDLFIYKFDRVQGILTQIVSVNPDEGATDNIYAVKWSSDGQYLAVGGEVLGTTNNDLFIYRFDRITETLTEVVATNPDAGSTLDTIFVLDWSPDGNYLAIGGIIGDTTGNDLFIYKFDRILETLTVVAMTNPDAGSTSDEIRAIAWSADSNYLAVGGLIEGTTNNDLFVYSFNKSTQALAQIISINPGGSTTDDEVLSVDWSPDGNYLAVGGFVNAGDDLLVYRFNKTAETLTLVASTNPNEGADDSVQSVVWSPDGQYLAIGGDINGTTGNDVFVYKFDRSTETLIEIDSVNPGGTSDTVRSVNWSPDGGYLALGGALSGTTNSDLFIYQALIFPSNNAINNNTVYCNSGNQYPGGVGISGSSIANLIIGNTSFDNPFNYQFVCNVFDQAYGEGPSLTQNISVEPNVPIITPDDIPTRIKRTQLLLESLIDNLL
jgi:WD40 repeat protein